MKINWTFMLIDSIIKEYYIEGEDILERKNGTARRTSGMYRSDGSRNRSIPIIWKWGFTFDN